MSGKRSKTFDLHEPLAIIGVGALLPGSSSLEALWRNVRGGACFIEDVTPDVPELAALYDADPAAWNTTSCKLGAKVKGFSFPYRRFRGLPPAAVDGFDEWARMALVAGQDAIDDAGLPDDAGLRANTFVAVANNGFDCPSHREVCDGLLAERLDALRGTATFRGLDAAQQAALLSEAQARYFRVGEPASVDRLVHSVTAAVAARLAKQNRLGGGHTAVDSACASSFAAMDLAARRLRAHEAELAVVGGLGRLSATLYVYCSKAKTMSTAGSFPFDTRASGFVPGEGSGFVVLQRLSDALRRGRPIHAVVRGIGAGSDGSQTGPWAPNKEGQKLAARRAFAQTSYGLEDVQYVECHGTGTQVGDAEELAGLVELLAERGAREPRRLAIGSAKASVGHLVTGAGMAGLLRALVAMQHGELPPTANVRQLNATLADPRCPLFVPERPLPWTPARADLPRRALINCFGFGGSNYSLLLEAFLEPYHRRFGTPEGDFRPHLRTVEAVPAPSDEALDVPIAVVGAGVDLPGARSLDALHELCRSGASAIAPIDAERFGRSFAERPPAPRWSAARPVAGLVPAPTLREKLRWRIPPVVLEHLDPNQFRLFGVVATALEEAKLVGRKELLRDTAMICGVMSESDFMLREVLSLRVHAFARFLRAELRALPEAQRSALADEYLAAMRPTLSTIDGDNSTSGVDSMLGSRVAKAFDLMGGTMSLDAACATAAVGLAHALHALRARELSAAVVCSSSMALSGPVLSMYAQLGLLSPEGEARPFDAAASGAVLGEGAAAFVLRRLPDALRDGQRVLGLVRGVGLASDGRTPGMVAPTEETIRAAAARAHEAAAGTPGRLEYVECQGLGIATSDALELSACAALVPPPDGGGSVQAGALSVGSAKGAIGQLRVASGFAALAKLLTSLAHGVVYPTAGFRDPSPALRAHPELVVERAPRPYRAPTPLAALNVFGVGGVSGHVLVSGPPTSPGARTSSSEAMERVPVDASTLAGIVHADADELREKRALLARTVAGGLNPGARALLRRRGVFLAPRALLDHGKVAFVFAGQSSAYAGMYAGLVERDALFRQHLEWADAVARRHGHRPFSELLYRDERPERFEELLASNFLSCIFQVATSAALEERLGLKADLLIGHSLGEFAAAVVSGAVDAPTGFELLHARYRCLEAHTRRAGPGRMAALRATPDRAEEVIAGIADVYLANFNGPEQTVIAGRPEALDRAVARAASLGVDARRLAASHAYHTPIVAPAVEPLHDALRAVRFGPLSAPVTSGSRLSVVREPSLLPRVLAEGWGAPVRFGRLVELALQAGVRHFVDVGPHWQASRLVIANLEGRSDTPWAVYVTNHAKEDDVQALVACTRELELALPDRCRPRPPRAPLPAAPLPLQTAAPAPEAVAPPIQAVAPPTEAVTPPPQAVAPPTQPVAPAEAAPTAAASVDRPSRDEATPWVRGDAAERGRAFAALYQGRLPDYAWLVDRLPPDAAALAEQALANFRGATPPEYLEELRSMADALGVEHLRAEQHNALMSVLTMRYGLCAGFATAAGVHGANYDLPFLRAEDSPRLRRLALRLARPGALRFVGVFKAGSVFPLCGLNEAGLAASFAAASSPAALGQGLHMGTALRMVLERCASLAEARALVAAARFEGSWTLLLSARGEPQVHRWEVAPHASCVVGGPALVYANHFQSLVDGRPVADDSRARLARLEQLVTPQLATAEAAQAVLGDRFDVSRGRETPFSTRATVNRVNTGASAVVSADRDALYVSCETMPSGRGPYRRHPLLEDAPAGAAAGRAHEGERAVARTTERAADRASAVDQVPASLGTRRWTATLGERLDGARDGSTPVASPVVVLLPAGTASAAQALERRLREALGDDAAEPGALVVAPLEALYAARRLVGLRALGTLVDLSDVGAPAPPSLAGATLERFAGKTRGLRQLFARAGLPARLLVAGPTDELELLGSGEPPSLDAVASRAFYRSLAQERDGAPPAACQALALPRATSLAEALERAAWLLRRPAAPAQLLLAGAELWSVRWAPEPPWIAARGAFGPRRGDTFLVTGGAAGITAELGLALARRFGGRFVLVGRSPVEATGAPPHAAGDEATERQAFLAAEARRTPGLKPSAYLRAWETHRRALAARRTLERYREAGVEVRYLAVDLERADAARRLREGLGELPPIDVVVHGAGVQRSKRFLDKPQDEFEAHAASKLASTRALVAALAGRAPRSVLLFGSVAGVNGNRGQCDYAAGNAVISALPRLVASELEGAAVRAVAWPAWDEVGMAVDEAVRSELEARGMAFLPPADGVRFALDELDAAPRVTAVVCSVRRADAVTSSPLYWPAPLVDGAEAARAGASGYAYVDRWLATEDGGALCEKTFRGDEPFLGDHIVRGAPTLPAVVITELVLQALSLLGQGEGRARIDELVFRRACVVRGARDGGGTRFRVRLARRGDSVRFAVTSPLLRRDGALLALEAVNAEGTATLAGGLAPASPERLDPLLEAHLRAPSARPRRTAEDFFALHRRLFPEVIGPSFHTLEHVVAASADAVLSRGLEPGAAGVRAFGGGRLLTSPGLVDLVNHTLCEYHVGGDGEGLFIPFRFRGVELHRPFERGARYWVSVRGIERHGDELRFAARVVGDDLETTLSVREVTHRRYERPAPTRPASGPRSNHPAARAAASPSSVEKE